MHGAKVRDKNRRTAGRTDPVLEDIAQVVKLLEENRRRFNMTDDEDLLDAFIYERNALMAQYRYLLRMARRAQPSQALAKTTAGGDGACPTPYALEDF